MEELFEQHSEKLFTYLRQHTQSREDAEDILVETFMAALGETKFAHLSETAQIAWLWRVARNGLLYVQINVPRIANTISYTDYLFAAYRLSDGATAWRHAMPPFPAPTSANTAPGTSEPVLAP
jgi:DNA-directed RNA polymerase specialized sigma24 family protein